MSWKTRIMALALTASAAVLAAQAPAPPQTVVITGSVVRYTPGQTIVIRGSDGRTITYSIGSVTDAPADIPIGRSVTISTQPASDGSGMAVVTRIETTTVNAQGQVKTTTERTEQSPAGTTSSTSTSAVYGTVTAYVPGQSITIERPGRAVVTYTIDAASQLPENLAVGKTVTVTTTTTTSERPVIRTMAYKAVTKTTKTTKKTQ